MSHHFVSENRNITNIFNISAANANGKTISISFSSQNAACHASGFWRVHFSARLPQLTEHASFMTNISQGSVATHLRWGGIFNDFFIANFLKNVIVKEF